MDMRGILSSSFSLYKKNLKFVVPHVLEYLADIFVLIFFAILLVIIVGISLQPFDIGSMVTFIQSSTPFYLFAFFLFSVFSMVLIFLVFNAFARAAIIEMAITGYEGKRVSLSDGLEGIKKYGLDILLYMLIIGTFSIAILSTAVIPLVFGDITISIFLLLFFGILMVLIYFLTFFTPQAIAVKKAGIIDGFIESIKFVRVYKIEVMLYILLVLGTTLLTSFLSLLFSLPALFFAHVNELLFFLLRGFQNIAIIIIGLFIAPYLEIVKTYMMLEGDRQ